MKKSLSRKTAMILVMVMVLALMAGCAVPAPAPAAQAPAAEAPAVQEPADNAPAEAAKDDLKVIMVPKFTGFSYFQSGKEGFERACADLGITDHDYVGTTTADVQGQAQVLQNLVAQKPDVVVAAIMDKDALLPALKALRDQGTIVITWDDEAAPEGQDLYCNMASYTLQGQIMLENALACNPDNKKIIWVAPSATNQSFIGKLEGIEWCIENFDRYKDFEIIDILYNDDDSETAYSMALSAMQAHPDMAGFVTGSGATNPSMNQAIQDSGNAGKIYATGFSIPDTMEEYIENGTLKEYSLWSPSDLGYMATYIGVMAARGELNLEDGATVDVPGIGEREIVMEDGRLVANLNSMQFFTKGHTTYETGLPMEEVLAERGVEPVD